ncbi:hypothetical protein PDN08_23765 [Bacillus cereus]|nr:hypothetical protein [Bacillus cereus]MDA2207813.1 hypothetical protein [Bacillus cereus]MDA2754355.1 hypothetical protein [Bacillus cereus]
MLDNEKFDNSLKQALINQSLLPLDSNSSWYNFEINYKYNEKQKHTNDLPLRKEVDKFVSKSKRGIYVIVDSTSEEVLYVGEGWVRNRLHEHIKKLYEDKPRPRNKFFKSIQSEIRIYWTECIGYHRRIALEGVLQCVLNPRYRRDDY